MFQIIIISENILNYTCKQFLPFAAFCFIITVIQNVFFLLVTFKVGGEYLGDAFGSMVVLLSSTFNLSVGYIEYDQEELKDLYYSLCCFVAARSKKIQIVKKTLTIGGLTISFKLDQVLL